LVSIPEDFITLILFFKDDFGGNPIFTIDARSRSLSSALHVTNQVLSKRASFDLNHSVLKIESLVKEDDGLYKCRVDYRRGRTISTVTYLSVVGQYSYDYQQPWLYCSLLIWFSSSFSFSQTPLMFLPFCFSTKTLKESHLHPRVMQFSFLKKRISLFKPCSKVELKAGNMRENPFQAEETNSREKYKLEHESRDLIPKTSSREYTTRILQTRIHRIYREANAKTESLWMRMILKSNAHKTLISVLSC
jgi:hypothetical protein